MKKFLAMCILTILLCGCGGYSGVVMKDNLSYVKFTGNWKECSIQVDNGQMMPLEVAVETTDTGERPGGKEIMTYARLFEISPGKHSVKVFKGQQLLVNRMLFFGNHQTTEVRVP